MKSNNSIIYFSVSVSIGYGIMLVLSILSYNFSISTASEAKIIISSLSIFFIFTSWIALVLDLGSHKKILLNVKEWKKSWIGKEIIAIFFTFFLYIFFYFLWIFSNNKNLLHILILISGISSLIIIYFSSKIYDSLSTIPIWNNPFVSITYVLNAISSGCLVIFLIYYYFEIDQNLIFYLLVIILPTTLFIKLLYWHSIKGIKNDKKIHSFFSHRGIVCILIYINPVYFIIQEPFLVMSKKVNFITFSITIIFAIIGLFLERWLFFIEANKFNKLENKNNAI